MSGDRYSILHRIELTSNHEVTGKTRHFRCGRLLPSPHELRIVQIDGNGDDGCYLIHFDERGEEQTDTYHSSVEEAMRQARWEFGIAPEEWSNAQRDPETLKP